MAKLPVKGRESLSQIAYNKIKSMILHKDLLPGQIVNEAQLQELLGIGRTPIREAILILAQDHLLTVHPRKGIEITLPTPKDVHDIFEVRRLLEPIVLRQCFSLVDLQWAMDMRALLLQHEDDSAGNTGETAMALIDLDNQFHLELVDTLHNQYVSDLLRSLVNYLNLIQVTTWQTARYRASNLEHIAILDAILDQDMEKSCKLLSDHLQLSYQEAIRTMMHTFY